MISLAEQPFTLSTAPSAAARVLLLEAVSLSTRAVFSVAARGICLGRDLLAVRVGFLLFLMVNEIPLKILVFISLTGVGGA